MSERKIGEGTFSAMGRLGLKELRNALNPSRESVADSEIGMYGTETQGEIAEARGGPGRGPDQENSDKTMTLKDLREHAQQRGRDDEPGKENDRGREPGDLER